MCTKNDLQLSLNGDTFQALKTDFDSILARTIGNMEMKGADEATITIKLGIALEKVGNGSCDDWKEVTKPSFKHDISSVMQVKDKKTGSLSGDYELVWDEEEKKYVMRKLGGEQMSVFDDENQTVEYEGSYEEADNNDRLCIEAPSEENEKELTPIERLETFIGARLTVEERNGEYIVISDNGAVVLTSVEEDSGNALLCPEKTLSRHVGHSLSCVGFYSEDDDLGLVQIRCDDCYELVFEYGGAITGEEQICDSAIDDVEPLEYDDPDED